MIKCDAHLGWIIIRCRLARWKLKRNSRLTRVHVHLIRFTLNDIKSILMLIMISVHAVRVVTVEFHHCWTRKSSKKYYRLESNKQWLELNTFQNFENLNPSTDSRRRIRTVPDCVPSRAESEAQAAARAARRRPSSAVVDVELRWARAAAEAAASLVRSSDHCDDD